MEKISYYIKEICPESLIEETVDVCTEKTEIKRVSFDSDRISRILGLKISTEDIEKILKNYNYEYEINGNNFLVTVPSWRLDLNISADFAEEIGRIYGYDKVDAVLPRDIPEAKDNEIWEKICLAKNKLVNDGYQEVINSVFRNKGQVFILASASDKSGLRDNLKDGLKESIELNNKNLPLLMTDEVKVFEIGTVFSKNEEQINVAFGNKKNINELSLDGYYNEIKDEFSNDSLTTIPKKNRDFQYFKQWSNYPFIVRDISVWLPEGVAPEKLIEIYKSFGTELLVQEPSLFDSFTKDNRTSFAYRLVFQSDDKTLTDDEVNVIMNNITEKIESLGYEVR
jgi:phenylalanyl-tRNA synthetase beta subunit